MPISKVGFYALLWCNLNTYLARCGGKWAEERTGTHCDGGEYLGMRTGFIAPNPLNQPRWHDVRLCCPGQLLFILYHVTESYPV